LIRWLGARCSLDPRDKPEDDKRGETRRVVALALSAALNAPMPAPRFGRFRM